MTLQGVANLSGHIPGIGSLPSRSKASVLRLLGREQEAIAVEHALKAQAKPGHQT